jgi:3-(3-hydroxy-phenyl)propionate hydroxylase
MGSVDRQIASGGYELPQYPFRIPPELSGRDARRYPVVIVGGGLTGLTLACDLAGRGVESVLLDEDDTIGVRGASSRGICYSQKSLEIFERLGTYARIRDKGITWSVGRTMVGEDEVFSFNLQLASHSEQPPFINLQQFYIEWFLVDRIAALGCCDLRWKNQAVECEQRDDAVIVKVETPAGAYAIEAAWVVDATGVNSHIRDRFGLDTHTSKSADRWCITDVRFKEKFPAERWTWVEAPFNDDRAVWQHLMGDNVWRLDYQMGPDADPEYVSRPEVAAERLRAHLGEDCEFELVWVGPYQYRDHLLNSFQHGRVFFIGDAAHVVSPFGARGGNSGIQDADNLGWKLALVLQGRADEALLDTYDIERQTAAAENLKVTSRTARFLAPRSPAEHALRKAAVGLAREYPFGRTLVNTGRMSIANPYPYSPAVTNGGFSVQNVPLAFADGRRSNLVGLAREAGTVFLGVLFGEAGQLAVWRALEADYPLQVHACGDGGLADIEGKLATVLGTRLGSFALIRPDLYLAGIMHNATPAGASALLARALRSAQHAGVRT